MLFHCFLIKKCCHSHIVLYRWTYRARYRPYRSIFRSISDDMLENDIYRMICYVYIGRAPKVIYWPIYRSYRPRFKSLRRDLQTSTQVLLKFTTTQLARLSYYHLHISKQSSSIKLLIVFNALFMKVFIIPILDAYHIRTNFIAKANYHDVLKDSQNNLSEA